MGASVGVGANVGASAVASVGMGANVGEQNNTFVNTPQHSQHSTTPRHLGSTWHPDTLMSPFIMKQLGVT